MLAEEHQPIHRLADRLRIGQYKLKCPYCQETRQKHRRDKPLSVKVDHEGVQYHCWHCGQNGGWVTTQSDDFSWPSIETTDTVAPISPKSYLLGRGISEEVIKEHVVFDNYRFGGVRQPAIGFPYNGSSATKWRSVKGKEFSQTNVCEDFFLMDTYVEGNSILICEGEMDALAWRTADLPDDITVVSVPNGAPISVKEGKPDPRHDKRFRYIWRAKEQIASAPRVYLNTDADIPGAALSEEIVRRIGKGKIWNIDLGGPKDAADAIKEHGSSYMLDCFHKAEPIPLIGLHNANDFGEAYFNLYQNGQITGAKTGLPGVDRMMCVPAGMLTIVTGFPGSGKSDIVDQFAINLARTYGWKTVYCSFEKPGELHMAQLAQKYHKKPFFDGETRMSEDEVSAALEWIKENFMFMDPSNGGPSQIDDILECASAAVMRMGCRILVIDPYNYITADNSKKETDSISSMLTKVRTWARAHDAHVFFIAHPTKVYERGGKYVCTGNDIAGSAAWFAKADIGFTMWRHQHDAEPPEAHVWKVRWGWMGNLGYCRLAHDPDEGLWVDYQHVPDDYDWDF